MTGSITASLAELLAGGSPGTSIPEDLYQLQLLWNGIKMAIEQKRQRLEQIQDLWKSFEEKKEVFTGFLTRVERRLREFPLSLAQAMDLAVIQSQIETQKVWKHGRMSIPCSRKLSQVKTFANFTVWLLPFMTVNPQILCNMRE